MQCAQCGYAFCRSYAEAIVNQEAYINRCAVSEQEVGHRLAAFFNIEESMPDTTYKKEISRSSATINEYTCIGCTICIRICPTDAIIGASGMIHAVIPDFCTGCGQCVPCCPLDAISLHPVSGNLIGRDARFEKQTQNARIRHKRKLARLHGHIINSESELIDNNTQDPQGLPSTAKKLTLVRKAIERAKTRLKTFGIYTTHN